MKALAVLMVLASAPAMAQGYGGPGGSFGTTPDRYSYGTGAMPQGGVGASPNPSTSFDQGYTRDYGTAVPPRPETAPSSTMNAPSGMQTAPGGTLNAPGGMQTAPSGRQTDPNGSRGTANPFNSAIGTRPPRY